MRRYASKLLVIAMGLFMIASGEATAVPIPVLFDITSIGGTGLGTDTATATGTSNGIGWSVSPTYISVLTVTNGTFGGFNVAGKHVPQIAMTDNLHLSRRDFTLPFAVPILSLLASIGENHSSGFARLAFGIVPECVSGKERAF